MIPLIQRIEEGEILNKIKSFQLSEALSLLDYLN